MNPSFKKWLRFSLCELRDILILVLISTFVTYLFVGSNLFHSPSIYFTSVFYGFIVGWTIWKGNQILDWMLGKRYPWDVKPVFALAIHLSSSLLYTVLDIVLVNYLIYRYVFGINLFDDTRRFLGYASIQFGISIIIITFFYFKHYFDSWRRSVVKAEELKRQALALQYETLKSYVNPHFLFNSLSVLSALVDKDTSKSQDFIRQLSDIYRYVLEQKDKELVLLDTEIQFVNSFINLHKIRHGNNLQVGIEISDRTGYVIPLSLQIIVENAFKHNIISEDEPLEVSIWREADYIVVQNNLQVRKTINESRGIGLETISKRYEFFNSQPLVVTCNEGFFTVKLPIIKNEALESLKV